MDPFGRRPPTAIELIARQIAQNGLRRTPPTPMPLPRPEPMRVAPPGAPPAGQTLLRRPPVPVPPGGVPVLPPRPAAPMPTMPLKGMFGGGEGVPVPTGRAADAAALTAVLAAQQAANRTTGPMVGPGDGGPAMRLSSPPPPPQPPQEPQDAGFLENAARMLANNPAINALLGGLPGQAMTAMDAVNAVRSGQADPGAAAVGAAGQMFAQSPVGQVLHADQQAQEAVKTKLGELGYAKAKAQLAPGPLGFIANAGGSVIDPQLVVDAYEKGFTTDDGRSFTNGRAVWELEAARNSTAGRLFSDIVTDPATFIPGVGRAGRALEGVGAKALGGELLGAMTSPAGSSLAPEVVDELLAQVMSKGARAIPEGMGVDRGIVRAAEAARLTGKGVGTAANIGNEIMDMGITPTVKWAAGRVARSPLGEMFKPGASAVSDALRKGALAADRAIRSAEQRVTGTSAADFEALGISPPEPAVPTLEPPRIGNPRNGLRVSADEANRWNNQTRTGLWEGEPIHGSYVQNREGVWTFKQNDPLISGVWRDAKEAASLEEGLARFDAAGEEAYGPRSAAVRENSRGGESYVKGRAGQGWKAIDAEKDAFEMAWRSAKDGVSVEDQVLERNRLASEARAEAERLRREGMDSRAAERHAQAMERARDRANLRLETNQSLIDQREARDARRATERETRRAEEERRQQAQVRSWAEAAGTENLSSLAAIKRRFGLTDRQTAKVWAEMQNIRREANPLPAATETTPVTEAPVPVPSAETMTEPVTSAEPGPPGEVAPEEPVASPDSPSYWRGQQTQIVEASTTRQLPKRANNITKRYIDAGDAGYEDFAQNAVEEHNLAKRATVQVPGDERVKVGQMIPELGSRPGVDTGVLNRETTQEMRSDWANLLDAEYEVGTLREELVNRGMTPPVEEPPPGTPRIQRRNGTPGNLKTEHAVHDIIWGDDAARREGLKSLYAQENKPRSLSVDARGRGNTGQADDLLAQADVYEEIRNRAMALREQRIAQDRRLGGGGGDVPEAPSPGMPPTGDAGANPADRPILTFIEAEQTNALEEIHNFANEIRAQRAQRAQRLGGSDVPVPGAGPDTPPMPGAGPDMAPPSPGGPTPPGAGPSAGGVHPDGGPDIGSVDDALTALGDTFAENLTILPEGVLLPAVRGADERTNRVVMDAVTHLTDNGWGAQLGDDGSLLLTPGEPGVAASESNGAIRFDRTGMGGTPNQQEIGYRGFTRQLMPREFLNLAAGGDRYLSGELNDSVAQIADRIRNGEAVSPPFVDVTWDAENNVWRVTGHEGRNRSAAIEQIAPGTPMEVDFFPRGMRARDITPEMQAAPIVSEDGAQIVGGTMPDRPAAPTRYTVRGLNNNKSHGQDATAHVVRDGRISFAVSDGVSSNVGSDDLAQRLVNAYADNPDLPIDDATLNRIIAGHGDSVTQRAAELSARQERDGWSSLTYAEQEEVHRYREALNAGRSTHGAATLVHGTLDQATGEYSIRSIGDSVAVKYNRTTGEYRFVQERYADPASHSSSLTAFVHGNEAAPQRWANVEHYTGTLNPDEDLFVMSDTLAEWFARGVRDGQNPGELLRQIADNEAFANRTVYKNPRGSGRNPDLLPGLNKDDDYTLLHISGTGELPAATAAPTAEAVPTTGEAPSVLEPAAEAAPVAEVPTTEVPVTYRHPDDPRTRYWQEQTETGSWELRSSDSPTGRGRQVQRGTWGENDRMMRRLGYVPVEEAPAAAASAPEVRPTPEPASVANPSAEANYRQKYRDFVTGKTGQLGNGRNFDVINDIYAAGQGLSPETLHRIRNSVHAEIIGMGDDANVQQMVRHRAGEVAFRDWQEAWKPAQLGGGDNRGRLPKLETAKSRSVPAFDNSYIHRQDNPLMVPSFISPETGMSRSINIDGYEVVGKSLDPEARAFSVYETGTGQRVKDAPKNVTYRDAMRWLEDKTPNEIHRTVVRNARSMTENGVLQGPVVDELVRHPLDPVRSSATATPIERYGLPDVYDMDTTARVLAVASNAHANLVSNGVDGDLAKATVTDVVARSQQGVRRATKAAAERTEAVLTGLQKLDPAAVPNVSNYLESRSGADADAMVERLAKLGNLSQDGRKAFAKTANTRTYRARAAAEAKWLAIGRQITNEKQLIARDLATAAGDAEAAADTIVNLGLGIDLARGVTETGKLVKAIYGQTKRVMDRVATYEAHRAAVEAGEQAAVDAVMPGVEAALANPGSGNVYGDIVSDEDVAFLNQRLEQGTYAGKTFGEAIDDRYAQAIADQEELRSLTAVPNPTEAHLKRIAQLQNRWERWGKFADATDDELRDTAIQSLKPEFDAHAGVQPPGKVRRLWEKYTRTERIIGLYAPWKLLPFMLQNAAGNTIQTWLVFGAKGLAAVADRENFATMLRYAEQGEDPLNSSVGSLAKKAGLGGFHPGLIDQSLIDSMTGNARRALNRAGGQARNGLVGRVVNGYVDHARNVNNALEWSFRTALWGHSFQTGIQNAKEPFIKDMAALAARHGISETQLRAAFRLMPDVFSGTELAGAMDRIATAAGVDPGAAQGFAREMGRQWQNRVKGADNEALGLVNKALFSFEGTKADEALSTFFKYHYWFSRAIPFYAEQMIRHPGFAAAYYHAHQNVDEQSMNDGLPEWQRNFLRFSGTPMGMMMIGSPLDVVGMFDLFAMDGGGYTPDNVSAIGRMINSGRNFGFMPYSIVTDALNMLGYMGDARFDLVGTGQFRNRIGAFAQAAVNMNLLGEDHAGYLARPVQDVLAGLRGAVSGLLPGSVKIAPSDSAATPRIAVQNKTLEIILQRDYGMTLAQYQRIHAYNDADPTSEYSALVHEITGKVADAEATNSADWREATRQWSLANAGVQAIASVLPGAWTLASNTPGQAFTSALANEKAGKPAIVPGLGVLPAVDPYADGKINANERDFMQKYQQMYGRPYEKGQAQRLRDAAYDFKELTQATPEAAPLVLANAEYQGLGDDKTRADAAKYGRIIAGALDPNDRADDVYVSNSLYTAEYISSLDSTGRRAVADAWLGVRDNAEQIMRLQELRDLYVETHPEYAAYDSWRDDTRKQWGWNDAAFRESAVRVNPNFKRYIDAETSRLRAQGKTPSQIAAELDRKTFSLDGYLAYRGIQKNKRDPKPLGVGTPLPVASEGAPVDALGGGGGGTGSGGGSKSSTRDWTYRVLSETDTVIQQINADMRAVGWGDNFDIVNADERMRDALLEPYKDALPSDAWLYFDYVDFARSQTAQGLNASVDAFIEARSRERGNWTATDEMRSNLTVPVPAAWGSAP